MRNDFTLLAAALSFCAFAGPAPLRAEEWKLYNVGDYMIHAPASWGAFRGDAPGSAILYAQSPAEVESYFLTEKNSYGAGQLPDMYQTADIFRKVASIFDCQLQVDPDWGGRPIAGQDSIGAYAPCANSAAELRVYITNIGQADKLLIVIHRYARSSAFDSEAYRYGLLDSIIIPKSTNREPAPGRYQVDGAYGSGGTDSSTYMGWLTLDVLAKRRYQMVEATVIGFELNGQARLEERGRFEVDGDQLILFSDFAPRWPAHDEGHQVPRRIKLH